MRRRRADPLWAKMTLGSLQESFVVPMYTPKDERRGIALKLLRKACKRIVFVRQVARTRALLNQRALEAVDGDHATVLSKNQHRYALFIKQGSKKKSDAASSSLSDFSTLSEESDEPRTMMYSASDKTVGTARPTYATSSKRLSTLMERAGADDHDDPPNKTSSEGGGGSDAVSPHSTPSTWSPSAGGGKLPLITEGSPLGPPNETILGEPPMLTRQPSGQGGLASNGSRRSLVELPSDADRTSAFADSPEESSTLRLRLRSDAGGLLATARDVANDVAAAQNQSKKTPILPAPPTGATAAPSPSLPTLITHTDLPLITQRPPGTSPSTPTGTGSPMNSSPSTSHNSSRNTSFVGSSRNSNTNFSFMPGLLESARNEAIKVPLSSPRSGRVSARTTVSNSTSGADSSRYPSSSRRTSGHDSSCNTSPDATAA